MKTILFPTDFSTTSFNAFEYARKVALEIGASINVLYVYHPHAGVIGNTGEYVVVVPDEESKADRQLQSFVESIGEGQVGILEKIKISQKVLVGFPSEEITDYAEQIGAELIIMGTRREHNIADKLFGSVTTATLAKAQCPVWVIPEEAEYKGIKNILYASSKEGADLKGMKKAVGLARLFGSTLHHVHVKEEFETGYRISERMTEQFSKDGKKPVQVKLTSVKSASVASGLNNYITENDIDLLVMLSQQKNLLERLFYISFTRRMAFQTRVPLLVLQE